MVSMAQIARAIREATGQTPEGADIAAPDQPTTGPSVATAPEAIDLEALGLAFTISPSENPDEFYVQFNEHKATLSQLSLEDPQRAALISSAYYDQFDDLEGDYTSPGGDILNISFEGREGLDGAVRNTENNINILYHGHLQSEHTVRFMAAQETLRENRIALARAQQQVEQNVESEPVMGPPAPEDVVIEDPIMGPPAPEDVVIEDPIMGPPAPEDVVIEDPIMGPPAPEETEEAEVKIVDAPPGPEVPSFQPTSAQVEAYVDFWKSYAEAVSHLSDDERIAALRDIQGFRIENEELFQFAQEYPDRMERLILQAELVGEYNPAVESLKRYYESHPEQGMEELEAAMSAYRAQQVQPPRVEEPTKGNEDLPFLTAVPGDAGMPDFWDNVDLKGIIMGIAEILGIDGLIEPYVDEMFPGYEHIDGFTNMFHDVYQESLAELNEQGFNGDIEQLVAIAEGKVQELFDNGTLTAEDRDAFMQQVGEAVRYSYQYDGDGKQFDSANFVNHMHEAALRYGIAQGSPEPAPAAAVDYQDWDNAVGKDLFDELAGHMGMMGQNIDDWLDLHMSPMDGDQYEDFFQSMYLKINDPNYAGEDGVMSREEYAQAIKDTLKEFEAQGRLINMDGVDIDQLIDGWMDNMDMNTSMAATIAYLTQDARVLALNIQPPVVAEPEPVVADEPVAEEPGDEAPAHDEPEGVEITGGLIFANGLDGALVLDLNQFDLGQLELTTMNIEAMQFTNGDILSINDISAAFDGACELQILEVYDADGDLCAYAIAPHGIGVDENGMVDGPVIYINPLDEDMQSVLDHSMVMHPQDEVPVLGPAEDEVPIEEPFMGPPAPTEDELVIDEVPMGPVVIEEQPEVEDLQVEEDLPEIETLDPRTIDQLVVIDRIFDGLTFGDLKALAGPGTDLIDIRVDGISENGIELSDLDIADDVVLDAATIAIRDASGDIPSAAMIEFQTADGETFNISIGDLPIEMASDIVNAPEKSDEPDPAAQPNVQQDLDASRMAHDDNNPAGPGLNAA